MDQIAATAGTDLILKLTSAIINPLIYVMFACALVVFVWGVRGYVTRADNPEARALGANQIMWGIIGMAIMLMTFTIVRIVLNTFGISSDPSTIENVNKILPLQ